MCFLFIFKWIEKDMLRRAVGSSFILCEQFGRKRQIAKIHLAAGFMTSKYYRRCTLTDFVRIGKDRYDLEFSNRRYRFEIALALDPFTPVARVKIIHLNTNQVVFDDYLDVITSKTNSCSV